MSGTCTRCHDEPSTLRLYIYTVQELKSSATPTAEEVWALGRACHARLQEFLTMYGTPSRGAAPAPSDRSTGRGGVEASG